MKKIYGCKNRIAFKKLMVEKEKYAKMKISQSKKIFKKKVNGNTKVRKL